MFPVSSSLVVVVVFKLINILVVLKDLERFRAEFRALLSIMLPNFGHKNNRL